MRWPNQNQHANDEAHGADGRTDEAPTVPLKEEWSRHFVARKEAHQPVWGSGLFVKAIQGFFATRGR